MDTPSSPHSRSSRPSALNISWASGSPSGAAAGEGLLSPGYSAFARDDDGGLLANPLASARSLALSGTPLDEVYEVHDHVDDDDASDVEDHADDGAAAAADDTEPEAEAKGGSASVVDLDESIEADLNGSASFDAYADDDFDADADADAEVQQAEAESLSADGDLEPAAATALFIPSPPAIPSRPSDSSPRVNALIEAQAVALERLLKESSAGSTPATTADSPMAPATASEEVAILRSTLSARDTQIAELLATTTAQEFDLAQQAHHLDRLEADRAVLQQRARDQAAQIEQLLRTVADFEQQVTQLEQERDRALAELAARPAPKQLHLDTSSPRSLAISPVAAASQSASTAASTPTRTRSRPTTPSSTRSRPDSAAARGGASSTSSASDALGVLRQSSVETLSAENKRLADQLHRQTLELEALNERHKQTCDELAKASAARSTEQSPVRHAKAASIGSSPSRATKRPLSAAATHSVPSSPKRSSQQRSPRFGSTDMSREASRPTTPSSIDAPLDGPSRRTFLQQSHELFLLRSALADAEEAHRTALDESTTRHEMLVHNLNQQLDELCSQNRYFVSELESLHAQHAAELECEKKQGAEDLTQIQASHAALTRDIAQQKRTIEQQELQLAEYKLRATSYTQRLNEGEQTLVRARARADEMAKKHEASQAERAELARALALLEATVRELHQHVQHTSRIQHEAEAERDLAVIHESDFDELTDEATAGRAKSALAEAQKRLGDVRREWDAARFSQERSDASLLGASGSTPLHPHPRTPARFGGGGLAQDLSMLFPQIPHASPAAVTDEISPFDGPDEEHPSSRSTEPTPFDALLLSDSSMLIGSPIQPVDESSASLFAPSPLAATARTALTPASEASLVIENHRLTQALRQAERDLADAKTALDLQVAKCVELKDVASEATGAASISRSQLAALEAKLASSHSLSKGLEQEVSRLGSALSQTRQDGYMRQLEAEQRVQDERNKVAQVAMEMEELAEALQRRVADHTPASSSPPISPTSSSTRARTTPAGLITPHTQKIRDLYRTEVGNLRAEIESLKEQLQQQQESAAVASQEELDQLMKTLTKPPPPLTLPAPSPSTPASPMPVLAASITAAGATITAADTGVPSTPSTGAATADDELPIAKLRPLCRKLRRDLQELGMEKLILQSQFLGISEQLKKKEKAWAAERRELESALTATRATVERVAQEVEARAQEAATSKIKNTLLLQQLELATAAAATATHDTSHEPNSQQEECVSTLAALSAELEALDASNQSLRSGLAAAVSGRAELEASLRAAQDRLTSVTDDLSSSLDLTERLEGQLRQAEHRLQQVQVEHANTEREWAEERRGLLDQLAYLETSLRTQQAIVEQLRLRRANHADADAEWNDLDQSAAGATPAPTDAVQPAQSFGESPVSPRRSRQRNCTACNDGAATSTSMTMTTTTMVSSSSTSFRSHSSRSPSAHGARSHSHSRSRHASPTPRKKGHARDASESLLYVHAATEQQVAALQLRVSELEEALHHAQTVAASAARDAAVSAEAARTQISDLVARVSYCAQNHDAQHVAATVSAVEASEHFRASVGQLEAEFAEAIKVEMKHHEQLREEAEHRHRTQLDLAKAERIELQALVHQRDEELARLRDRLKNEAAANGAGATMRKEVTTTTTTSSTLRTSLNGATTTESSFLSSLEFRSPARPNTFLLRSPLGPALIKSTTGQEALRAQQAKEPSPTPSPASSPIKAAVASATSAAAAAALASVATDAAVVNLRSSASATALAQFAPLLDSIQSDKQLLEETILRHIASLDSLERCSQQLDQLHHTTAGQQEAPSHQPPPSSITSSSPQKKSKAAVEEKEEKEEATPTAAAPGITHAAPLQSVNGRTPRASPSNGLHPTPRSPSPPRPTIDPPETPLVATVPTPLSWAQAKQKAKTLASATPKHSPSSGDSSMLSPAHARHTRARSMPRGRGPSPAHAARGSSGGGAFALASPMHSHSHSALPLSSPIESSAQVSQMLAVAQALESDADKHAQAHLKSKTTTHRTTRSAVSFTTQQSWPAAAHKHLHKDRPTGETGASHQPPPATSPIVHDVASTPAASPAGSLSDYCPSPVPMDPLLRPRPLAHPPPRWRA